jgi:hypothetical protein
MEHTEDYEDYDNYDLEFDKYDILLTTIKGGSKGKGGKESKKAKGSVSLHSGKGVRAIEKNIARSQESSKKK